MATSTAQAQQAAYVQAQFDRVKRLELLYMKDGRHRLDHPYHALYTGLHTQAQEQP